MLLLYLPLLPHSYSHPYPSPSAGPYIGPLSHSHSQSNHFFVFSFPFIYPFYVVPGTGTFAGALEVEPRLLDLGGLAYGKSATRVITLFNRSNTLVHWRFVSHADHACASSADGDDRDQSKNEYNNTVGGADGLDMMKEWGREYDDSQSLCKRYVRLSHIRGLLLPGQQMNVGVSMRLGEEDFARVSAGMDTAEDLLVVRTCGAGGSGGIEVEDSLVGVSAACVGADNSYRYENDALEASSETHMKADTVFNVSGSGSGPGSGFDTFDGFDDFAPSEPTRAPSTGQLLDF